MLEHLYEHEFFRYFEEISSVPRGSGYNEKISRYLVDFAERHNLEVYQDKALNVIIRKPASAGFENAPGVILQGHMDMVCEKDAKVEHDFLTQGLELAFDDEAVFARGTTLGGDDGIAIAYGLAILASDTICHPALELVVTTDEETGMFGAKALDMSRLQGKYYINLDSEEEGTLLVGCAGGMRIQLSLELERETSSGIVETLELTGLKGGHSGCEIDKNRTNAVLLMGRMLQELRGKAAFRLCSLSGGNKDNAIPREAKAVVMIAQKDREVWEKAAADCLAQYKAELAATEPELQGSCKAREEDGTEEIRVLTDTTLDKVLTVLLLAPNGVQRMSGDIPGLVESSLNMGIFRLEEDSAEMTANYSLRSSVPSYRDFMAEQLRMLAHIVHAAYWEGDSYPAWVYRRDSRLRGLMAETYLEMTGQNMKIEVIHAGLECGIVSDARPDIEIVSIGPDILDIHTPQERLVISSAVRTYEYLLRVLDKLAKEPNG